MLVNDIIEQSQQQEELRLIKARCQQFLHESQQNPLLKNLPITYGDFHKVKVRHKRIEQQFDETFNDAFTDKHKALRQRAVFTHGIISFEPPIAEDLEPFYIFPIDGYRFLYSKEVENSSNDYKQVFDTLLEQLGEQGMEMINDLLRVTYTENNLVEGIESGSEIILFNIPYYYAIRVSTSRNYQHLLTKLDQVE